MQKGVSVEKIGGGSPYFQVSAVPYAQVERLAKKGMVGVIQSGLSSLARLRQKPINLGPSPKSLRGPTIHSGPRNPTWAGVNRQHRLSHC